MSTDSTDDRINYDVMADDLSIAERKLSGLCLHCGGELTEEWSSSWADSVCMRCYIFVPARILCEYNKALYNRDKLPSVLFSNGDGVLHIEDVYHIKAPAQADFEQGNIDSGKRK